MKAYVQHLQNLYTQFTKLHEKLYFWFCLFYYFSFLERLARRQMLVNGLVRKRRRVDRD